MRISDWSSDVCSSDLTVRWNPPFGLDLADFLRRSQQAGLEARIGNADERLGDLVIVLRAQIGHAVFGDDDVPQVARNRRVPVVEQHVADRLAAGVAYRAIGRSPRLNSSH